MAGNVLRASVELDDGGVTKKINGISKAFDKTFGKGSSASFWGNTAAKAVAKGFDLVGGAMDVATKFAFDSIDAFSQLEQSVGGVESVFGEAAKSIKLFGDGAAESVGLSKRAVFEFAAVIGAKLEGLGFAADIAAGKTQSLIERAADMAATFGGPTSDAVEAISALLTGETDPIEKYGVSIKQADINARILALGLDTTTTAAKKNATATAALQLLYEQTSKTTGQFSAQSNTLAEKQQIANAKLENAQAILGEKLAPILLNVTNFIISDVIPAIEAFGRGVAKVSAFLSDMFGRIDRGIKKVQQFIATLQHLLDFGDLSGSIPNYGPYAGHAAGGWVGLHGPEMAVVGERGPEYIVPNHQLGNMSGGGSGFTIQGVSRADMERIVDQQLFVLIRRAAPGTS